MRSGASRADGVVGHRRRMAAAALCANLAGMLALASAAFAAGDTTPPTIPANMRVVSTTELTVTLAWDAATDNVGVDHYTIYRDGNQVGTAPATASPTYVDTGLWPHSTHTYYATASDAAGNMSGQTTIVTGVTKSDTTPPTAPTNLVATFDVPSVSITLTWNGSTDNVYVDHYDVYRNLVRIASTPAGTLRYVDTSPPTNTTVKYLVQAVDEFSNNSNSSNQPQIITDIVPPSTVTDLHITSATNNAISLAWTPATDNYSVSSYDVFRNGTFLTNQSSGNGSIFYNGGLPQGTQFSYTVVAKDPTGNRSNPSNTATATTGGQVGDTQPPTAPSNLTAAIATGNAVTLTWNASSDNTGVQSYEVNRNGTLLATTNTLTFKDATPPTNIDDVYTVTASDAAGNVSPLSNQASVYIDTAPPTTPTNVVTKDAGASVNLTWSASTDNIGLKRYAVLRDGAVVGTTTSTVWADTTAPRNATMTYTVTATDTTGNTSAPSDGSIITTTKPAPPEVHWPGGFLSDMTPTSSTNGTGTVGIDKSTGGQPLTIDGVTYAKGLGMYAPADAVYDLSGQCTTFAATVGVDDESGKASVAFQLFADGTKIFDSLKMTAATAPKDVSKSVAGKQTLELKVVHMGTGATDDSADWVLPRLTCATWLSDAPQSPPTMTIKSNSQALVQFDQSGGGHPITIAGVTYAKGIGVTAPSSISFQLNGQCNTFSATVGVDDEVGDDGSVAFRVFADGTKVWDSGTMTGVMGAKSFSKSVIGTQALELRVVHIGTTATNDSADWAMPKLVCSS